MKFFLNLFTGRLNRRNYIIGLVSAIGCFFLFLAIIGAAYPNGTNSPVVILLVIFIFFAVILFNISLQVRRAHDLNKSGVFVFLFVIPLVNLFAILYLLLTKGTEGKNSYGAQPSYAIRYPQDILNTPQLRIPLWLIVGLIIVVLGLVVSARSSTAQTATVIPAPLVQPVSQPLDTPTNSPVDETYFRQQYMQGCNTDFSLTSYCGCTYSYLRDRYTLKGIQEMAIEYSRTNQLPKPMNDAAAACLQFYPTYRGTPSGYNTTLQ